jgi:tRNA 5-methylaminomethyl-2-thiouridine biosynthesis bifunctional protein
VLACGTRCQNFAAGRHLEITGVHGQIDRVEADASPSITIVGDGYLVPDGQTLVAGATYEYRPWEVEDSSAINLAQLGSVSYRWIDRERGVRCVSSDRLPIAGLLATTDDTQVYVTTGHGSMGATSSHLAAGVIASNIAGSFAPLTSTLEASLSPARFVVRQNRRGYRLNAQAADGSAVTEFPHIHNAVD